MSSNSHELIVSKPHPALAEIGVSVPKQAVRVKFSGGELSVSTDPKAPLDIQRVNEKRVNEKGNRNVIDPAVEIVLDSLKRTPEHSESLQTPDRENLIKAIEAGIGVQEFVNNLSTSTKLTHRYVSYELRAYRGSKLPPRVSHDLGQRRQYLIKTGKRIEDTQERLDKQLKRANEWLSRLPDPPSVGQLPKAARIAGSIATAATMVTPLAAQADAKTAASQVSITTESIGPQYAFQSQGMSETRVNTAALDYLMSLPPIPEEKTPSHNDQEGSEFIATPQTPSEPTPTATVQPDKINYNFRIGPGQEYATLGILSTLQNYNISSNSIPIEGYALDGSGFKWILITGEKDGKPFHIFIREDALVLPANFSVETSRNIKDAYTLATRMPVFDSDEKAINVLTSLEPLDTLMKALNGSTFPPETLDSLAVFSSQKDQSGTYTDVYIQTRDLEGTRPDGTRYTNEAGSLIMISSPYGDTQPRFLPPNIVLDHLKSQGKDYTTISYTNGGNIIRVINPETTATIANLDVQTYLRTGSLEQSMVVFETEQITLPPVLGVFMENNFSSEFRYLNPNTNTYEPYDVKRILDKVNPTEIINNPLTINGEVVDSGRVEINGKNYLMVVGSIIEQTSIPNGNYHSVITTIAIPRPITSPDGVTVLDTLHIDDPNRMPDLHKQKFVVEDPANLLLVNPEETTDGDQLGTLQAISEHQEGQIILRYNSVENKHVIFLIEINPKTEDLINHLEQGVPLGEDRGRFAKWVSDRLDPKTNDIVKTEDAYHAPTFFIILVDPDNLNQ